ncbi:MAG: DUF6569 family protein, partial [Planctomycetota bacterium]
MSCFRFSLLIALSLFACTTQKAPPIPLVPLPEGAVARLDVNRTLLEPIQVENLTVWPVVAAEIPELGDFYTLSEAQARGLAEVREAENAQVRKVVIENRSELPILVCAG